MIKKDLFDHKYFSPFSFSYIFLPILFLPDCLSDPVQCQHKRTIICNRDSYIRTFSSACLADEEMKLEEEKIDELTKKEEYERIKAQLKAKRVEEERKIAEEKR